MSYAVAVNPCRNGDANKLLPDDEAFHAWYRFVLSYPPHLVREYLERFGIGTGQCVLDPFCGTGTTLVTCKRAGVASVGAEGTPMGHFASAVKVDWTPDPGALLAHAQRVAGMAQDIAVASRASALRALPTEAAKTLLKGSISPMPLHRVLVLRDCLEALRDDRFHRHELLALAKALPCRVGNLRFGPEVGVGQSKDDAPVLEVWLDEVRAMADDLERAGGESFASAQVHLRDSRDLSQLVPPGAIDAVVTSPPYPNEKDYTRIMRLEMAVLGLVQSPQDLQSLKRTLLCSNTRTAYKANDDDRWVADLPAVTQLADAIEARRLALGKTSGFERQYHRVVRLYFGGMYRHLASLRPLLRPGARLAYVVGDQASYLQVMIRTGQLLGEIAAALGYEFLGLDLFRTRLATATREQLREEVLLLRWPG
jgi:DNA modification methylase